jgi:hypothetical protein
MFRTWRSKRFCGGLTHREPLLDEVDFERFVATVDPLLKAGRDVLWVLAGRTDSNLAKVKHLLKKYGMQYEVFYLCYNTRQMQHYGYWKGQRGIAKSKSMEPALYVYKGPLPKNMPQKRMYVDAASPLFNQVVKSVPVLAPMHQAFVSMAVRETSLTSMVGLPLSEYNNLQDDDDGMGLDQPNMDDQKDKAILTARKKRKLYQPSKTDVPWFPHDNDMALLKEFCWESGTPRWVLHGTPAGGAGVHGCLEMGCSVVALCYDEHHQIHLQKSFVERAVQALVSGKTQVFKDEALLARSIELKLTKKPKVPSAASASASTDPKPVQEPLDSDGQEEIEATPKKQKGQKAATKKKEPKPKAKATLKKKGAAKNTTKSDSSDSDRDASDCDTDSDSKPPAKRAR